MAKVIVDADWVLEPKVKTASDILMAEGKGLIEFRAVDVIVDGAERPAVEVELDGDMADLVDAIRRAGLEVLENTEKVGS